MRRSKSKVVFFCHQKKKHRTVLLQSTQTRAMVYVDLTILLKPAQGLFRNAPRREAEKDLAHLDQLQARIRK